MATQWNSATQNTSMEWLKLTLEKEMKLESDLLFEMTEKFKLLISVTPNEIVFNELKSRLVSKVSNLKMKEMMDKENKHVEKRDSLTLVNQNPLIQSIIESMQLI